MKRRFLPILLILALCLGLLPVTALAAGEDAPNTLYVGNQQVISGSSTTYWTTDNSGGLTRVENATDNSANWSVRYNPTNATLTLKGANITGNYHQYYNPHTAGIYALCSQDQPVALTIELIGTNTITGTFGIFLNAEIDASSYGTNATLTITGENNGSLEVSGSYHGIYVKSGTGNASLNIEKATVTSSTNSEYDAGVYVMSGANATGSPNISLSVNGGSLTASGTESSDGIWFYVGSSQASDATTSLTVSGNAIVDAKTGGIKASDPNLNNLSDQIVVGSGTGTNGGIVFDGKNGTVYGDVTLQEDLEIGEGESLTIGQDASLTTDGKLTVNGGTLNGTPKGDVTYKVTGVSLNKDSLTLDEDSSETLNATVAPNNATNQEVTWTSNEEKVATVDESGKVVAVAPGTATITVTTKDGSKTDTCTVVVTHGNLVHTPKQEPTCNDVGTQEYWTCDICGKHYSDSSATDEVSLADLTIPQLSCPTQSTSSSSTQPTATYDDGGPFTTDQYGNVYDRWGNEIWHNPSPQSASNTTIGYQLVATIDK